MGFFRKILMATTLVLQTSVVVGGGQNNQIFPGHDSLDGMDGRKASTSKTNFPKLELCLWAKISSIITI
jgi:hypothetical protein